MVPGTQLGLSQFELGCGVQVLFVGEEEAMEPAAQADGCFQKVISMAEPGGRETVTYLFQPLMAFLGWPRAWFSKCGPQTSSINIT